MNDNRKDFLMRLNKGRRIIHTHIAVLNETLNLRLNERKFIDLKQSDIINQIFADQFISTKKKFNFRFELKDISNCEMGVQKIRELLTSEGQFGFLLGDFSLYCGAILLPINLMLDHFAELIQHDRNSLEILTENLRSGLLIDFMDDLDESQVRKDYYDFICW